MKKIVATAVVVLVLGVGLVAAGSAAAEAPSGGMATAETQDLLGGCPICDVDTGDYSGPLSPAEIGGLLLALNDEYRAWAIYDQVIQDHGAVAPFTNIRQAEAQHIRALVGRFEAYGLPVPENPWPGNVPSFDSVQEAAAAGVEAEVENGALYDRLFGTTEREDILAVYQSLQRASIENHLPAFERAAGRVATGGTQVGGGGPRWSR